MKLNIGSILGDLVSLVTSFPLLAADVQALVAAMKKKGALTDAELAALIESRLNELATNPALQPDAPPATEEKA